MLEGWHSDRSAEGPQMAASAQAQIQAHEVDPMLGWQGASSMPER
jgi:hypothetical protein